MSLVDEFESLAKKAIRIAGFKSPKRQYSAMLKLFPEWRRVSQEFLFTSVNGEELLAAYTKLDHISSSDPTDHTLSMVNYFSDFAETLDTHTDRMFFNAWVRCQICLQNAIEHGTCAFERQDDGSN